MTTTARKPMNGHGGRLSTIVDIAAAERGLLSCCASHPERIPDCRDIPRTGWTDTTRGRLWGLLQDLSDAGTFRRDPASDARTIVQGVQVDAIDIDQAELRAILAGDGTGDAHLPYWLGILQTRQDALKLSSARDLLADDSLPPADRARLARAELDRVSPAATGDGFEPMLVSQLMEQHPCRAPFVIDGILREGEVADLANSPKLAKTFFLHGLAFSIATGRDWLGHRTAAGRVLLIDLELKKTELAHRLISVCSAMQIDPDAGVEAWALRGQGFDINAIARKLERVEHGQYRMIAIDPLYKVLPPGVSENDNAQMARVMATIDGIAERTGAAMFVIHHAAKGDGSGKSITDTGAGAGSISRSVDSHLVLRPHDQEGLAVFDRVTRSWPRAEPFSVRFDFPTWSREWTILLRRLPVPGSLQKACQPLAILWT